MTQSRRLLTGLALGALMAVTACHRAPKNDQTATPAAPSAPVPLTFANSNADAEVSLTLPEAIKLYPELHARLFTEAQTTLTAFMDQAHKDRAQNSADGIEEPPYYHSIVWKIAAQTPRLVSVFSEEDDYQGGAHPNHTIQTLLWDKTAKTAIDTKRLFRPGADFKAIDAYLCHQVEAERSKRAGEPISQSGSGFACPKFAESRLVLIPAAGGGTAGAIDALYAPYDVGPYAEGPYEIRVPQTMLGDVLAPEFSDQFGGDPVKDQALSDPDAQ
ncbi:DUF3298 and DUF4163 domain-containing protein [Asticcacaulis taihuensis]|uniref:Deacetylase PdaC domain-containing protein n=1 Tax=Asticcacaulis taihuensis TaxID=260084 RepID=A0A1G4RVP3_9CAUL|nr:DUF3298 and DUF4163 domain-containing protein [Asticcacaulis taihuensis]SCW61122.1 Protein of unknown function [Asticcacaulis taihuensis]